MIADISNRTVSRLQPGHKVYEVRDKRLKGFLLRVLPSGKMSFICQYTRGRRITIGHVGIVTAAQARDEAREILARYELNGSPENGRQNIDYTLKGFIDDEYAPWVLLHRKTGKLSVDRIRLHFFKDLADKKLHEITPHIIEKWQIQRLKSGTKANTINRDIATLKAALSKAVEWGLIHDHPLSKLKLLKVDNTSITRYLTESEETALRQALDAREEEYRSRRESWNEWRRIRGQQQMETSCGQKTHPYRDINILSSIVCVTMFLKFASDEA